jgi:hypothetical protein
MPLSLCTSDPKMKGLLIIGLLFLFIDILKAQEKYIGIRSGLLTQDLFNKYDNRLYSEKAFFAGINAEYIPRNAMFSISTGIEYFFRYNYLLIPLSVNLYVGRIIKFGITGGVNPLFRLNPVAPNKVFVICGNVGAEISYKINQEFAVFSDFGLQFIPELSYSPSHFGGKPIDRSTEKFEYLCIGLKYLIDRKQK